MKVTVVSLEKCDATPAAISLSEDVAGEMGVKINIEHIQVKTREDAIVHRHIGSPTVRINGLDIEPVAREHKQYGVT